MTIADFGYPVLALWCFCPKTLNDLAFQSFDFERTWWRLFWAYLMKVILSVPDEGYFERTWWRLFWAYLMKVISEADRAHLIWYLCFYSAIVMTNLQTRYHKSISLNSMLLLCFNVSIKYSCSPCVIVCFVCLTSHVSLLDMYVSYFSYIIIYNCCALLSVFINYVYINCFLCFITYLGF